MKQLNDYRMRIVFVGFVTAIGLGGGSAKANDTWLRKNDMSTTRYLLSTSVVDGKIYAIGGAGGLTRVDEYNPVTDTWTNKADMSTEMYSASTCVVNGMIYVMGGESIGGEPVSMVQVYDPTTDTWAEQTELPTQRVWFSTSVVDDKIYVIGGRSVQPINAYLKIVEEYNPATNVWTTKADMPLGKSFPSTCVVDGIIYAIGGWSTDTPPATAKVEAYDPRTDTWTRKAPMLTARYLLGTSVVGGKIYAIGGWKHSAEGPLYSTVEVYDPLTDTWTSRSDMPVPTAGFSTSVVDGKIYVIGGALTTHNGTFLHTSAVYEYYTAPSPDLNGDGAVDIKDLLRLIESWSQNDPLVDIAPPFEDGVVNVLDLELLMSYWGQPVDDPSLIAHWPLDETEGIFATDSMGDNDALLVGGTEWQPSNGRIDGTLNLDGASGCAIAGFALNPADGPFSIIAWIKGGAPGQVIVSQQAIVNWLASDADGNLMTELKSSDQLAVPLFSEAVITDGQWHRIGLVWDGSYRTLYVDGVAVAEDTQPGLQSSQMGLYIGTGKAMEAGTYFSGMIDDVRIYGRPVRP
jgi:N-acetylneuraminic acid mutarotase